MTKTVVGAVIASRRDDGDWRDLDLCVRSLAHYTPSRAVVAWKGPASPPIAPGMHVLVEQPDHISSFGAAYQFAAGYAIAECATLLLLCNDDVVLCPDSFDLLVEDYMLARGFGPVGFVAARANYARPSQRGWGPMAPAEVVSPFCALVEVAALPDVWPDCNWYSDDVMCADMADQGRRHWISRSYVHHVGERSTGSDHAELDRAGRAWVAEHRPDLAGRF